MLLVWVESINVKEERYGPISRLAPVVSSSSWKSYLERRADRTLKLALSFNLTYAVDVEPSCYQIVTIDIRADCAMKPPCTAQFSFDA